MYELVPMEIAASGMSAQRARMGVVSSNLANARSTRTPDGGGPYKRGMVVFQAGVLPAFEDHLVNARKRGLEARGVADSFSTLSLGRSYEQARELALNTGGEDADWLMENHMRGVDVPEIAQSDEVMMVYEPGHPDADPETGMVAYPDIQVISEMTDLIQASRLYEANLSVMKGTRDMITQLAELLRS
jgi:flagellar basal-body rod protein FlgC